MVNFFARRSSAQPTPNTIGNDSGNGTSATGTAATPQAIPMLPIAAGGNAAARQSQRPRLAGLTRPGPPPVLPEIAHALADAHQAHQEVAARVDGDAAARAALRTRQQSTQALRQRTSGAENAAAAEHLVRDAEQKAAAAAEQHTRDALPGLNEQVRHHGEQLTAARLDTEPLERAVAAAKQARHDSVQFQDHAKAVEDLKAAQGLPETAPPARAQPATAGGQAQPVPPTRSELIAGAQERLARTAPAVESLNEAVTGREKALQTHKERLLTLEGNLKAAEGNEQAGKDAHTAANQRLTAANAAVKQLVDARRALTDASNHHEPALQRHEKAADEALTAATATLQPQRELAEATATAAEHIRTAATLRDEVRMLQARVDTATEHCEAAHRKLRSLEARVGPLEQAVGHAGDALAPASTPGAAVPPPTALQRQQRRWAEQQLTNARRDVETQREELNRQQRHLDAETASLRAKRTALERAEPAETAAIGQRTTRADHAKRTDDAASDLAGKRDALKAPADEAHREIGQAVDRLCQVLLPAPAVPERDERTTGDRAKDTLWRQPLATLQNRTAPLKVDISVGPLSGSRSGSAPTGFHDGLPPVQRPTEKVLSDKGLKAVDKHAGVAGAGAANLLAEASIRTHRAAQTPTAFGSAKDFSAEIGRMFAGPAHAAESTPVATVLAQALLQHPNPDPTGRPDGHPLRHEQALLIATTLRSVTSDPHVAAQIYNSLWSSGGPQLPGMERRDATASPLAQVTTAPPDRDLPRQVNAAKRALAATAGGMQALLDLQGLSLPPLPPTPAPDAPEAIVAAAATATADRKHAEQAVEHYKLGLRAETALLSQGLAVGGDQTPLDFRNAIVAHGAALNEPSRLGSGTKPRPPGRGPNAEHKSTLPAQAFLYADDNLLRARTTPDRNPAMKPAYVALRNGFTESGAKTDFHLMAKRLHKFTTYIDLACKSKTSGPSAFNMVSMARRLVGKDKTPLKTLLQAGPLGSELGTVPGEHAKRLKGALNESSRLLREDLNRNLAGMGAEDRTRAVMRLAVMEAWNAKVPAGADPLIDLTQGTRVTDAEIRAAATRINTELATASAPSAQGAPQPAAPALTPGIVDAAVGAHAGQRLMPDTLNGWIKEGHLSAPATDPAVPAEPSNAPTAVTAAIAPEALAAARAQAATDTAALRDKLKILRGKAAMDSELAALQSRFDNEPAQRPEILRQVMNSVVAGGDMTDYSDGRKNGIGGVFGYGVASVKGIADVTTGITPVGEFNVDHTRTAVLKAGVASNTGVIFLGNETKVSEMLGGGVRIGAKVGDLGGSVQAMARLGGSHLFSKGLMIRTNKTGVEHKDLTEAQTQHMRAPEGSWKRMSELVVNSVFELAARDGANGGPRKPANGGEMWAQMVDKVGDYRDISFGWNEGKTHQFSASLGVDGAGGGKFVDTPGSWSASGTLGIGLKHVATRSKAKDVAGATRTVQAGSGSRTSVGAAASFGVSHPTIKRDDQPDVGAFARHKVGVETELVIQAKNGFVRITTEDGKVKPNISYKHREYAVQDDFIKLVNKESGQWQARLGQRGPDGVLRGGDEALKGFLQQMVNLPPGNNRLFIERKCLTPEAADTINACLERINVLQRPGAPVDEGAATQIKDLQKQIAAHVEAEASWQPFRLFVNELNQRARDSSVASGEFRATPKAAEDKEAGPQGFAERFLGGGKVTLGGKINTAHGGRDLITIDAQPVRL